MLFLQPKFGTVSLFSRLPSRQLRLREWRVLLQLDAEVPRELPVLPLDVELLPVVHAHTFLAREAVGTLCLLDAASSCPRPTPKARRRAYASQLPGGYDLKH